MFTSVLFFVIIMVLLIIPGFVLRKIKMIGDGALTSMINIMLYVCSPMLIFKSLFYSSESNINPTDGGFLLGMGIAFLLGAVTMLVIFFLARIVFIKCGDERKKSAYIFASVFGNVGFIGIPFMEYVLAGQSVLPYALVFATMYNISFNILCWTLGVYIMTRNTSDLRLSKIFLNPILIITIIALPLYLLQIDLSLYVAPLSDTISYLGSMITPLSLIIVGIRMADVQFKSIFKDGYAYLSSVLRLIITPLIAFGIMIALKASGLLGVEGEEFYDTIGKALCLVVVILSGLPAATSTIAFAEKFGGDGEASINAFVNSTIATLITLPFIIPLLCSFF